MLELRQVCFLPFQFRFSQVELAARLLHLISVMDWFNFSKHLPLSYLVILLDNETDDAAGNHIWSNVDDVRLDKRVLGDGVGEAVGPPMKAEVRCDDRYPSGDTPSGPTK